MTLYCCEKDTPILKVLTSKEQSSKIRDYYKKFDTYLTYLKLQEEENALDEELKKHQELSRYIFTPIGTIKGIYDNRKYDLFFRDDKAIVFRRELKSSTIIDLDKKRNYFLINPHRKFERKLYLDLISINGSIYRYIIDDHFAEDIINHFNTYDQLIQNELSKEKEHQDNIKKLIQDFYQNAENRINELKNNKEIRILFENFVRKYEDSNYLSVNFLTEQEAEVNQQILELFRNESSISLSSVSHPYHKLINLISKKYEIELSLAYYVCWNLLKNTIVSFYAKKFREEFGDISIDSNNILGAMESLFKKSSIRNINDEVIMLLSYYLIHSLKLEVQNLPSIFS